MSAMCLSGTLLAAEVFVVGPQTLLIALDGEPWKAGEALCVGRGRQRTVCGKVVSSSPQGLQLNLTLAGGTRSPRVGDPVEKVDGDSRLTQVLPNQTGAVATQSIDVPWQVGDPACVSHGDRLDCGEITEVRDWEATVRFSTRSGKVISQGQKLWRAPGTARVVWQDGARVGFAQSENFPWRPGMDFEVRNWERSLARGSVTQADGANVVGLLQSGAASGASNLWVNSLMPRRQQGLRQLASIRLQETAIPPDQFAVVGWNTVFPFVRMDWRLSPFVYGGVGLSYHRLGLDGGQLTGTGIWLTATYFLRGDRQGPWFQGALVPGRFTARRDALETTDWALGGAFLGGWQGRLSDEAEWGLGGGLQYLGAVGTGATTLNTTGLFPSLVFHLAYGF